VVLKRDLLRSIAGMDESTKMPRGKSSKGWIDRGF